LRASKSMIAVAQADSGAGEGSCALTQQKEDGGP